MRSLLRLVSLLAVLWAAPAWALQPVYVDQMGAKPDGVVRTDCSITSGQAVLTCTAGQFVPQDVGKVIAVYEAGPLTNTYRQPLSTTIASRQSATQVTLAATASATANPSTRVVYGTNNTTVLQRILDTTVAGPDGRGSNLGGEVVFGPGRYLVKQLSMACNAVGVDGCTRSYNHVTLRGAGQSTTALENWDITTTAPLLQLGDPNSGVILLDGITLADMTFQQVALAASTDAKVIQVEQVQNSTLERLTMTGTSYECLVFGYTVRVMVRHNYASGCGGGGPGYTQGLSAYNITACFDCLVQGNVFDLALGGASYPAELGVFRGIVQGNHFVCDPTSATLFGVQGGSNGRGYYNLDVLDNVFDGCPVSWGNGSGTFNRLRFNGNTLIDAGLTVGGGASTNPVDSPYYPDVVTHSTSVVASNTFIISGQVASAANLPGLVINVGGNVNYNGTESWLIQHNTLVIKPAYCTGGTKGQCQVDGDCTTGVCALSTGFLAVNRFSGGQQWRPGTVYAATPDVTSSYVYPVVYNGYFYHCTTGGTSGTTEPTWPTAIGATVNDGSAVWTNAGRRPTLMVANNTIQGPERFQLDYVGSVNAEVDFRPGADADAVTIVNLSANYPWRWTSQTGAVNAPQNTGKAMPAGAVVGTLTLYDTAVPTMGYYAVNTQITNTAPSSGHRGWVATRAGRAGAAWQADTAYAFGAWVVPTGDNGHAYTQRTAAGCTSATPTEPSWNAGAGTLTTDNDCSWKESGAAVLWLEF